MGLECGRSSSMLRNQSMSSSEGCTMRTRRVGSVSMSGLMGTSTRVSMMVICGTDME